MVKAADKRGLFVLKLKMVALKIPGNGAVHYAGIALDKPTYSSAFKRCITLFVPW